jgi:cation transport regulator ChaC
VKAHLDFREKNGYETLTVDVYRPDIPPSDDDNDDDDDGGGGEGHGVLVKNAHIYVASTDNHAFLGPKSLNEMAMQIVESVGPSGRNVDCNVSISCVIPKKK